MINLSFRELCNRCGLNVFGGDWPFAGISIDTRTLKAGEVFVAIKGPQFDGHDFIAGAIDLGASAVIGEQAIPALSVPYVQVDDSTLAMGTLAKAWRSQFKGKVIAITGSCGKTTTKEMLLKVLQGAAKTIATRGNLNNHWGLPLSLLQIRGDEAYAIIELGTDHPGEIGYLTEIANPDTAVITTINNCHVEGFGSLDAIAQEKSQIYKLLGKKEIAVINSDLPYAREWSQSLNAGTVWSFSQDPHSSAEVRLSDVALDELSARGSIQTPSGPIAWHVNAPGEHIPAVALTTIAIALALGVALDVITVGLSQYQNGPGRFSPIDLGDDVILIDDTYNASPESVRSAIKWLGNRSKERILVLGSMAELGDDAKAVHHDIAVMAIESGVDQLWLTGERELWASAFELAPHKTHYCTDIKGLTNGLKNQLNPGTRLVVKGARRWRMERVVAALSKAF